MEIESKVGFGARIEVLASKWYLERFPAAHLVASNFRSRIGEIDLIFEQPLEGNTRYAGGVELVFVEVRARLPGSWQGGLQSVGVSKQRRLVRTIQVFLSRYRGRAVSVRIDVLAWDGTRFEHTPNLHDLAGQT